MVKTPERENQTPEKEGIEEENGTREKATRENDTIDLSGIQSDEQDTPDKETRENDEDDEYLPAPPEDIEQDNQNEKERGGEMK